MGKGPAEDDDPSVMDGKGNRIKDIHQER
jgi:hypothetical protein